MSDPEGQKQPPKQKKNRWLYPILGVLGFALLLQVLFPDADPAPKLDPKNAAIQSEINASVANAGLSGWRNSILNKGRPCDQRMAALGSALAEIGDGVIDQYSAYEIASSAQTACKQSWLDIGAVETPNGDSDIEDKMDEARESCKMAAYTKSDVAEAIMEMLDKGPSPARLALAKEETELGSQFTMDCISQLNSAAPTI